MNNIEMDWQKYYHGRCNGCGNCYQKDEWINQRTEFLDVNGLSEKFWDKMFLYFCNEGQNHEGNGVCIDCAEEYEQNKTFNKIES